MNIASITRIIMNNVVTGSTGNIALALANDGYTFVTGAIVIGGTYTMVGLPFISTIDNGWYMKIRSADSNEPVVNTTISIRFLCIKLINA